MLEQAFKCLSPKFSAAYQVLLSRELPSDPLLGLVNDKYRQYATSDSVLPRPILAYMGYHAMSEHVDFSDTDGLLDMLLIAQLLRDILAIHDDVVDEDREKFGAPTLPLSFSSDLGLKGELTRGGKDMAIFYGDILFGVLGRLIGKLPLHTLTRVQQLVGETLAVTSSGQVEELLIENSPVLDTSVETILRIAERKAARYCYVFPFCLGAYLAGHSDEDIGSGASLLLAIGRASQVIDDITGAFPGVVDEDKDSIGEIRSLRRTVPLVLFAQINSMDASSRRLLTQPPPLSHEDAIALRFAMWKSEAPQRALELCEAQLTAALRGLALMESENRIGGPTKEYLADLIEFRLRGSLERLRKGISEIR